ncbi:hypothetical protein PMAYCL1PPCAC_17052 [Pristionchus mayeri]|uniref:Small ribosomal subunit protein eS24 n=1 Tax=Pristionchus mayeri TaxID=1317129 RepID=A0AAN5HZX7_9BILA|nr:hypothetical protein PMAYCL1PPCAC_17052 [Pristionchus mayeri]
MFVHRFLYLSVLFLESSKYSCCRNMPSEYTMGDVITIRTRKVKTNRLLARKQMVVELIHPSHPSVSKREIRERLAALYKTTPDLVVAFGFRCKFGGGKSEGFALVYDSLDAAKKFDVKHRLEDDWKSGKQRRCQRKVKNNLIKTGAYRKSARRKLLEERAKAMYAK